jgi:hypothetical protein
MKPTPVFVAAAGFAMIGACTVREEDGSTESADSGPAVAANADAAPAAENAAGTDTLGNQLNQLNTNASAGENSTTNSSE